MILGKLLITIWVLFYLILVMGFKGKDEFLFMSSMIFGAAFITLMWGQEISKLLGG